MLPPGCLKKKGCERHLRTILFHDDLEGLGLVLVDGVTAEPGSAIQK